VSYRCHTVSVSDTHRTPTHHFRKVSEFRSARSTLTQSKRKRLRWSKRYLGLNGLGVVNDEVKNWILNGSVVLIVGWGIQRKSGSLNQSKYDGVFLSNQRRSCWSYCGLCFRYFATRQHEKRHEEPKHRLIRGVKETFLIVLRLHKWKRTHTR